MVDKKNFLKNQRGQAIFELIIFLPFLIFLYSIYYTVGNSISASINQQKSVRGYFYSLVKGNSYLNTLADLQDFAQRATRTVGFSAVGWREKGTEGGQKAMAPCFKFSSLLKNSSTEECEGKEREEPGSSRFIRIFTFYGVCGPVYFEESPGNFEIVVGAQNNPAFCYLNSGPPS